ncbi:MAG TPA: hypothetical protein VJ489_03010 [Thermoplasmata archaeon]|nr:hypothetical protein [Thermoplasmata archaeon]
MQQHKLFLAMCDLGEPRLVSAKDCGYCPHGSVIDNKSRVICAGITKFFVVPCTYDMRAAATLHDCGSCLFGSVGEDCLRVMCSRI